MRLGINLPQFGKYASRAAIVEVAQGAEQLGCEAVWVQERLLRPAHPRQPYAGMMMPWPEAYRVVFDPIETLTYAAAVTQRVRLGTSVLDALFHSPLVLGRRLATLDQLSEGRAIVGLGQGWSEDEYAAVNVSPKLKGRGFEEFVQALRAIWGPDPVSFEGRFYRVAESEVGPKPRQQPHPPLLLGGFAPAAIQRAGRLGLGFNPALTGIDALAQSIETFRSAAREAGHDPARLPVIVRGNAMIGDRAGEGRWPLTGSFDQVREDAEGVARLLVDHLFLDFYLTDTPPSQQLRYVEELQKALGLTRAA